MVAGYRLVKRSEFESLNKEANDLESHVVRLVGECKNLVRERDALISDNQKLSADLKQKSDDKDHAVFSCWETIRIMLAALKLAEQYIHANLGDQGKIDNRIIRNAIAEGEKV